MQAELSALQVVCLTAFMLLFGAGKFPMQQARYFDGDPDAHWWRSLLLPLLHTPRHPHAILAKRRGWIFLGLAAVAGTAGFIARAL